MSSIKVFPCSSQRPDAHPVKEEEIRQSATPQLAKVVAANWSKGGVRPPALAAPKSISVPIVTDFMHHEWRHHASPAL
jgi:hypothetical protein